MLGLMDRRLHARVFAPLVTLLVPLVPLVGCGPGGDEAATGSASEITSDPGSTQGTSSATGEGSGGLSASDSVSGTSGTSDSTEGTGGGATDFETTTGDETGVNEDCLSPIDGSAACCKLAIEGFEAVEDAVDVTLKLTVNGQPLNQGESDDGDLYLVSGGDRILVGHTTFGTLKARVFPGAYDLVYESESHGPLLPWNARVTLLEGIVVAADKEIQHDIPVVRATGKVTINGAAPPTSPLDDADLFFVDPASGARTLIARTSLLGAGGSFSANLVPGEYEVRYVAHLRKDVMPYNSDSRLADVAVAAVAVKGELPPDSAVKDVAIASEVIAGDIFVDDVEPPASPLDHARIYLRDRTTDAVTLIADTAQGGFYDIPVLAGPGLTYDVIYAMSAHKAVMPMNEWAIVAEDLDAGGVKDALVKLNLDTVLVGGTFTIDQAPPVNDAFNSGEIVLGLAADRAVVGGAAGSLAGVILAGTYDVFFRHSASDGQLPLNTRGRVQSEPVSLLTDDDLALAVQSSLLDGTFQIGGATPPPSAYDTGRVFLRNADGDVVHLGYTSDGTFSRRLIDGAYDVYYSVQATQGGAPANHESRVGQLVVDGDAAPVIDVPATKIAVTNPIEIVGTGAGRLYLRDLANGDEVFVGTTSTRTLEATLVPSDYALVYRVDLLGDAAPANNGAAFGCIRVE
ncbi:MAG: hypothetical protein R3B09_35345 [Nannocystaceae bacterium]